MDEDKLILEKVLTEKSSSTKGMEDLEIELKSSTNKDYTRIATAYRVCRTLQSIIKSDNTWHDFCGNLRHAVLLYKNNFQISNKIYNNINKIVYLYKMYILKDAEGKYSIGVSGDLPLWFGSQWDLKNLYDMKITRNESSVVGDPFLFNLTGHKSYKSYTQKLLIDTVMKMPKGTTLLGCMPTGAGKSLVGLMDQYYLRNGITIIIVPTIALAIDQANSATKYYINRKLKPVAYHSELDEEAKEDIIVRLKDGTLPILYISPEALLNSRFNNIVLEVASKNLVNTLVIDEAHIVHDWGEQFRTEFQFLSIYRRKLLKVSGNKIKTILLSATYTDKTVKLLRDLFSEKDNFIEVRGDALRPEIQYFVDTNKTNIERINKIKEIIPLLPRPIIIYVIKPEDARSWKQHLGDVGFKSVECFTGDISSRNIREGLLNKWNSNNIDIMVATSAFGMGVDKLDVRTVIHCCIPESINRFYQEVGRGGRDGQPSISLLSVMPSHDMEDTLYLINPKVMTTEKFTSRWVKMKNNIIDRVNGDTFWVDTNLTPDYIEGYTGKPNVAWNEYVILLLYRKKYLEILDMRTNSKTQTREILIMVKSSIVDDIPELQIELEILRNVDLDDNRTNVDRMKMIVTSSVLKDCFSFYFSDIYPKASLSCGGCSYCRENGLEDYSDNSYSEIITGKDIILDNLIINKDTDVQKYFNIKNQVIVYHEYESMTKDCVIKAINYLNENGVDYIIVPNENRIDEIDWNDLNLDYGKHYLILQFDELINTYNDNIIGGRIGFIYPTDVSGTTIEEFYLTTKGYANKGNEIIHLIKEGTTIENSINIDERIDGPIIHIKEERSVSVAF